MGEPDDSRTAAQDEGVPDAGHFTCARCHRTFPKAWTEAEAEAEASGLFGNAPVEDMAVVCDDCWQTLTGLLPHAN